MENVLFKISFPAEFHAQTAVECAMQLHPAGAGPARCDREDRDRDAGAGRAHHRQDRAARQSRPTAITASSTWWRLPLIFGRLTAEDYEDAVAADPRVDALRAKMMVQENPTFTQDYYAADKRYIGNAVQVFFKDGSRTERVQVDFPIGHRKRRAEGMPVLVKKFETSVAAHFPAQAGRARSSATVCRPAQARRAARERAHGGAGEELTRRARRAREGHERRHLRDSARANPGGRRRRNRPAAGAPAGCDAPGIGSRAGGLERALQSHGDS